MFSAWTWASVGASFLEICEKLYAVKPAATTVTGISFFNQLNQLTNNAKNGKYY